MTMVSDAGRGAGAAGCRRARRDGRSAWQGGLVGGAPGGAAVAADPDDAYRAQYHFTVPDHWKNDPQRPVFVDGKFHYYYLYNGDYDADPAANFGTAWRLATSYDGVVFADQGVAAPKKTNANYDLWSGSAVVDHAGTAGFGAGAVVMLVTQMDHPTPAQQANASGPQAQFLWYSTDGGRNFRPYGEQPVIPNGGRADFRDPKVMWDADRGRWVALDRRARSCELLHICGPQDVVARVGVRQSAAIGTIECPDLFRIRADDGTLKWVFGVSANGYATNEPATFAYWTGSFDGTSFSFDRCPAMARPRVRLVRRGDLGGPGRAAGPPVRRRLDEQLGLRPHRPRHGRRTASTARTRSSGRSDSSGTASSFSLVSQPVAALEDIATTRADLGDVTVDGFLPLAYEGEAYQVEADVTWQTASNVGLQLRRSADGTRHADVGR